MNTKSVFIKVAAWFGVVYTIYSLAISILVAATGFEKHNARMYGVASNYLRIGRLLLRNNDELELNERLQQAAENFEIGFYMIRKNRDSLFTFSNSTVLGAKDPIPYPSSNAEGVYEDKQITIFAIHEGEYTLFIGYKTSLASFLQIFAHQYAFLILKDLIFVLFIFVTLVVFAFRDYRAILRRLKRPGFDRTDLKLARSSETLTLIQGLKGYQENANALTKENALLKGQVLPALQNELRTHHASPYEFECTLVRTDINNFTSVFSGEKRGVFMDVINEFFNGVAQIASRYHGFIYEFIGDEVIFYFKDEDHANSAAVALSAVRDINFLADKFNERTESQHGFNFRVKSSLSKGTLRFGPLVNGYSLAGSPLIETVRMLSHISEKSKNTILFDDSVADQVRALVDFEEFGLFTLKGLADKRRLHLYLEHKPLSMHLDHNTPYATYFRSDENICEILSWIERSFEGPSSDQALMLLSIFQSYKVTDGSFDIQRAYLSLFDKAQRSAKPGNEKAEFLFCSLISVSRKLFVPADFYGPLRERFLQLLKSPVRRVLANTLDVFIDLDPGAGEGIFEELIEHRDNRVAANALVKQARRELNRKSIRRLKAFLKSESPYFRASAIYALSEIAADLKSRDEVAYNTSENLRSLLDLAATVARDQNPMVQRQALRLADKTGRSILARAA